MTRPFTGQRKVGVASVVFAALIVGGGVSLVCVITAACWACCSGCFSAAAWPFGAGWAFCAGGASGCETLAAFLAAGVPVVRVPGMRMRSPILSVACGSMLLALASSGIDLPYLREIFDSVSPGATMCVPGAVAAGAAATLLAAGAGRRGAWTEPVTSAAGVVAG